MKLGGGELVTETDIDKAHAAKEGSGFGDGSALAKDPGEEFKLSDIIFVVEMRLVDGVADEIETGGTKTFFVDAVVEKWIIFAIGIFGDVGDADDSIMRIVRGNFTESEGEMARNDDGFFAVRKFVVEVAPEVGVSSLVGGCGAH